MTLDDAEQERVNLRKMNPITIVEYIKNSIDILINLKVEEKLQYERKKLLEGNPQYMNQNIVQSNITYEKVIKELEASIKNIRRSEQEYKTQYDNLKAKYDCLEREFTLLSNTKDIKDSKNLSSMSKSKSKDKASLPTNRTSQTSNFINQSGQSGPSDYYHYPQKVSTN